MTEQRARELLAWEWEVEGCPMAAESIRVGSPGMPVRVALRAITTALAESAKSPSEPFQARVAPWMQACFGPEISADTAERNHRFLEEALELVQATGCTAGEAHQLVDYVYGRPVGDPAQEVGGVMVTLAALCLANGLDMHANAETELARIWTKVEAIRAKQAAKPKHSPLPEATAALTPPPAPTEAAGLREAAQFLLWQFDRKGPVADSLEAWEALRAALAKSPPAAVGTNRG
jgi:hypothetical protein